MHGPHRRIVILTEPSAKRQNQRLQGENDATSPQIEVGSMPRPPLLRSELQDLHLIRFSIRLDSSGDCARDCRPVSERDRNDSDGQGSQSSALQCASENSTGTICADSQKPRAQEIIR